MPSYFVERLSGTNMKLYLATISISECEYSSGLAKYFPNKAQATKYAKEWCKENEDITLNNKNNNFVNFIFIYIYFFNLIYLFAYINKK